MADETEPLLEDRPRSFLKSRLLLVPVVVCYFAALGIFGYAISVYYHHKIRDEINGGNASHVIDLCNQSKSDPAYRKHVIIQQETAKWTIYFCVATYVPALFGNIVWGAYSDIMGRRRQFIISIIGTLLRLIICSFVVKYNLSFAFLVVASAVDGALGSFPGILSATCAYIADVSPRGKTKTWRIVVLEILVGLSTSIVLFATGYFLEAVGYFYPLLVSCVLLVFDLAFVIMVLPETLQYRHQEEGVRSPSRGAFQAITTALRLIVDNRATFKQPRFILLALAFIFYTMPILSRGTLEVVYQLGPPFCWSPRKLAWFGGSKAAIGSVANIGGTYVLHKCMKDDTIALIAGITGVLAYIVEGLAATSEVLYIVPALQALSFLPVPIFRSLLSDLSTNDKQGMLFGSIGLMDTLCGLFGALISNLVYETTMDVMNGLVFLLLAGLSAIGMAFLVAFIAVKRLETMPAVREQSRYASVT